MQELERLEKRMFEKYALLELNEQQMTFFEQGPLLAGGNYRELKESDFNTVLNDIEDFTNFLGEDNLKLIQRCKIASERKQRDLDAALERAQRELDRFDVLTKTNFAVNGVPEPTYQLINALKVSEELNKKWGVAFNNQGGIFTSRWYAKEINDTRALLLKAVENRTAELEQAVKVAETVKAENESISRGADGVFENFSKANKQLHALRERVQGQLDQIELERKKTTEVQNQVRDSAQVASNPTSSVASHTHTTTVPKAAVYISDMDEKKSDKLGDVKKALSGFFSFLKKLSSNLLSPIVSVLEGSASRNPSAKSRAQQMQKVELELQEYKEKDELQSASKRKPSTSSGG